MCRLEKDTDGTMDAHEGNHTPTDGAGMEGEGGKPDTRPGDKLAIIRRNPGLSVFTHAATLTASWSYTTGSVRLTFSAD